MLDSLCSVCSEHSNKSSNKHDVSVWAQQSDISVVSLCLCCTSYRPLKLNTRCRANFYCMVNLTVYSKRARDKIFALMDLNVMKLYCCLLPRLSIVSRHISVSSLWQRYYPFNMHFLCYVSSDLTLRTSAFSPHAILYVSYVILVINSDYFLSNFNRLAFTVVAKCSFVM
jgi:hypothetical protein